MKVDKKTKQKPTPPSQMLWRSQGLGEWATEVAVPGISLVLTPPLTPTVLRLLPSWLAFLPTCGLLSLGCFSVLFSSALRCLWSPLLPAWVASLPGSQPHHLSPGPVLCWPAWSPFVSCPFLVLPTPDSQRLFLSHSCPQPSLSSPSAGLIHHIPISCALRGPLKTPTPALVSPPGARNSLQRALKEPPSKASGR